MASQLQLRRGTTAQHVPFIGAPAEVTVDTDKKTVVVHDGSTAGGFPSATAAELTAGLATKVSVGAAAGGALAGAYPNPTLAPVIATGSTTARSVQDRFADMVNVKDFGAIGDGNPHPLSSVYPTLAAAQAVYPFATSLTQEIDWAAIQSAVNEAMKTGKMVYIIGPGPYLISDTIVVKITRDAAPIPPSPSTDVHFLDLTNATIVGFGMPTLKATTAVASMMELIFDVSDADLGPFYSKIEGIGFNGNNLAVAAIKSDYTMHCAIVRNRIWNVQRGIEYLGYAVSLIQHNTIRATYGLYFPGPGGGDSMIFANDFYSPQGVSSACCYFGYYTGNTKVTGNTFTNEYGAANTTHAIQVSGGPTSGQEARDLVIDNNEFSGFTTGVRMDGQSSGNKNVYRIIVTGNRTLPYGTQNDGALVSAADCQGLHIVDNLLNGGALNVATGIGIDLVRCVQTKIADNKCVNYNTNALVISDCVDTEVVNNSFIDCAKSGNSFVVVNIYGSSSARNYFKNNYFRQSDSAGFGEYAIVENTGVDYTYSFDNIFDGFNIPHIKLGANSIMRRTEYLSSVPATGNYNRGDIIWNTLPSAAGTPAWVCTTSGTTGVYVFKAMANVAA
jgi:hypothetical protein